MSNEKVDFYAVKVARDIAAICGMAMFADEAKVHVNYIAVNDYMRDIAYMLEELSEVAEVYLHTSTTNEIYSIQPHAYGGDYTPPTRYYKESDDPYGLYFDSLIKLMRSTIRELLDIKF